MIVARLLPFVLVALIVGLIVARAVRGTVWTGPRGRLSLPSVSLPQRKRHLRVVDRDAMDRELNELLKRK